MRFCWQWSATKPQAITSNNECMSCLNKLSKIKGKSLSKNWVSNATIWHSNANNYKPESMSTRDSWRKWRIGIGKIEVLLKPRNRTYMPSWGRRTTNWRNSSFSSGTKNMKSTTRIESFRNYREKLESSGKRMPRSRSLSIKGKRKSKTSLNSKINSISSKILIWRRVRKKLFCSRIISNKSNKWIKKS